MKCATLAYGYISYHTVCLGGSCDAGIRYQCHFFILHWFMPSDAC